jgi:uncharacterized protein (DUF2236 family)
MYHPPDRLGPDSLLWRCAGDTRIAFLGGTIGILQLMHPAIGAGVVEHSNFFEDPADRVFRSLPAILGAVYDEDADATGRWVRDQHATIKGTDAAGRRYHALDPATYWWAHATFQFMAEQVVDRFDDHRLSPGERERLYQEGITWYRTYAVSERPVPANRAAFQAEWDRICRDVLEPNAAVRYVVDLLDEPVDLKTEGAEDRVSRILGAAPVARLLSTPSRLAAIGGLPPVVREKLGIRWRRRDQVRLDGLELAVRKAWRLVPFEHRWQPRAQDGWRRVRPDGTNREVGRWPATS